MAPDKNDNPDRSQDGEPLVEAQSGPVTERQTPGELAASQALSVPEDAKQHTAAPKIRGLVLTELLGEGAYGKVWRAWQIRTSKEVAVKIFERRSGLDWILLQREVERLAKLDRHPNIVSLLDVGLDEEPPYYVMDLLEGGALQSFVTPQSPAPTPSALRWMGQICDALAYVHSKGLIHCDLKPGNILVDRRDGIRVLDFGQSRVFTESAASLGTLFYMAPEQAMLSEPGRPIQPDVRWDIYGLGATLYAILTGQVPHGTPENRAVLERAENLTERLTCYRDIVGTQPLRWRNGSADRGVGRELVAIVNKCMAPDPESRYATVTAVAADIEALKSNRPISPLAGSIGYRVKKFLWRNPFKLALVTSILLLIAAGAITWRYYVGTAQAQARDLVRRMSIDPGVAAERMISETPRVQDLIATLASQYVASASFTERILGVRTAPLLARAAFWRSVDGGQVWANGEWLEICRVNWPEPERIMDMLKDKAAGGTPQQKYVAFCLLGELGSRSESLAELCFRAAQTESQPGVVSAAAWAAGRLGRQVDFVPSERIYVDDVSGIVFLRIPPSSEFRPGSPSDEVGRYPDEDRPEKGISIDAISISMTEVTQAQFAPFLQVGIESGVIGEQARGSLTAQYKKNLDPAVAARVAVHDVSYKVAREYCEWISDRAAEKGESLSYRLPTEAEWEYVCRAGHSGAFCYGDSELYFQYFSTDYSEERAFEVATRMPNWYGLFDMHGNVWEICDSPYLADYNAYGDARAVAGARGRVVQRGGAAYSKARACRCAQRNFIDERQWSPKAGFRVVMEQEGEP